MNGETDLTTLLRTLAPTLDPECYVFCSVQGAVYGDFAHVNPLACFRESEGLTLVLTQSSAEAEGLLYNGTFRCITLHVYSSLHAVGLTATLTGRLAEGGISVNMIAGYYHDHVFIPADDAAQAMALLKKISDMVC